MKHKIVLAVIALGVAAASASLAAAAASLFPGWMQTNADGFGDSRNGIGSLAVHDGQLYAGTWSWENGHGAQVWRSPDGHSWTQFSPPWSVASESTYDLESFGQHLYAGIDLNDGSGGEIWRTGGATWQRVVDGGFGDAANIGINAFAVFDSQLYAATTNETAGMQIWRSPTGDPNSWSNMVINGFGQGPTGQDAVMEVFDGELYAGLGRITGQGQFRGELWRSPDGINWTAVFTDGLGSPDNSYVSALADFQGQLYVGLRNLAAGGEVWRTADGEHWSQVVSGGLGAVNNSRPYGLEVYADQLFLVFSNTVTGAEIWTSRDGAAWQRIVAGGWDDSSNGYVDYFDKGAAVLDDRLFMATLNQRTGGELWLKLRDAAYLPLVMHR